MNISIRSFEADDIPAGMQLKDAAGWNQVTADWELIREMARDRCFAAILSDTVVGTAAVLEFETVPGRRIGWVGMVLVDPNFRRRGIGTRLLEGAITASKSLDAVFLDATPQGQMVYEKLGFEPAFTLTRWRREGSGTVLGQGTRLKREAIAKAEDAVCAIATISAGDFRACFELDSLASGLRRQRLLTSLRDRSPRLAFVHSAGRDVTGFCLGRRGSQAVQIGPLVALDMHSSERLLTYATMRAGDAGLPVFVDARDAQSTAGILESLGYVTTRRFLRMSLRGGSCPELLDPGQSLIAIVGPEFG